MSFSSRSLKLLKKKKKTTKNLKNFLKLLFKKKVLIFSVRTNKGNSLRRILQKQSTTNILERQKVFRSWSHKVYSFV